MSKIDMVRAEMVKAMKSGDKKRKDVLSLLLSALKAKTIDKRSDLTEDEENTVVQKEIRQTKESLETAPAGRKDVKEHCAFALSVLQEFAPEPMGEDQIRTIVKNVFAQLGLQEPKASDKGRIMKTLMPQVKGKADGGLVSKIVSEYCK